MRSSLALAGVGVGAVVLVVGTVNDARACGGCFHEPPPPNQTPDVVTDHRMIFSITPQQTTLYDEIEYQGDPASFAWVLPIHGTVTVGLSSDRLFGAIDALTQVQIVAPQLPSCPSTFCNCGGAADGGAADASVGVHYGKDAGAGVSVVSQQVVGPYETVQLQSTNPTALTDWLAANGYTVPPDVAPVIAQYVSEGFDFLAMKLQPGQGVKAMRPVRVTSAGAGLSLPLRMVAAGTGATVGITLWVVADGPYVPQNFQSFSISPGELTWDWSSEQSDYTTIRAQKEAALAGAAWQIESSLDLGAYAIESPVLAGPADTDYEAIPAPDGGTGDAGDAGGAAGETAEQVREDDLATLFPGGDQGYVRVTRLRADLSHAALATDLILEGSTMGSMPNTYYVTKSVNAPACPAPTPCDCPGGNGGAGGGKGCSAAPRDEGTNASAVVMAGLGVALVLAHATRRRRRL